MASGVINTKKDKKVWTTSGNYGMVTTMKRIVCTIKGVEMLINRNMVGRAEVMFCQNNTDMEMRRVEL